MAQDAVDAACATGRFPNAADCRTMHLPLVGSAGYTRALFTDVAQHYVVPHRPGTMDTQVARYLAGELLSLICHDPWLVVWALCWVFKVACAPFQHKRL